MEQPAFECEAMAEDLVGSIPDAWLAELEDICCHVLAAEGMTGFWTVSIALMADEAIAALHQRFMQLPDTTDILTFGFDEEDEPGGDIAISVPQAERQRQDDGWELLDELRFLVAHGALHLAGWDDATPGERSAMIARQRELLANRSGS